MSQGIVQTCRALSPAISEGEQLEQLDTWHEDQGNTEREPAETTVLPGDCTYSRLGSLRTDSRLSYGGENRYQWNTLSSSLKQISRQQAEEWVFSIQSYYNILFKMCNLWGAWLAPLVVVWLLILGLWARAPCWLLKIVKKNFFYKCLVCNKKLENTQRGKYDPYMG